MRRLLPCVHLFVLACAQVVVPLASQVVPAGPISKSTNVVVAIITAQSEKLVALLAAADILDLRETVRSVTWLRYLPL
jgi:hypothetical protein